MVVAVSMLYLPPSEGEFCVKIEENAQISKAKYFKAFNLFKMSILILQWGNHWYSSGNWLNKIVCSFFSFCRKDRNKKDARCPLLKNDSFSKNNTIQYYFMVCIQHFTIKIFSALIRLQMESTSINVLNLVSYWFFFFLVSWFSPFFLILRWPSLKLNKFSLTGNIINMDVYVYMFNLMPSIVDIVDTKVLWVCAV